jgi:hypothetical protein
VQRERRIQTTGPQKKTGKSDNQVVVHGAEVDWGRGEPNGLMKSGVGTSESRGMNEELTSGKVVTVLHTAHLWQSSWQPHIPNSLTVLLYLAVSDARRIVLCPFSQAQTNRTLDRRHHITWLAAVSIDSSSMHTPQEGHKHPKQHHLAIFDPHQHCVSAT